MRLRAVFLMATIYGCAATKSSVELSQPISADGAGTFCGQVVYSHHNADYLPLSIRNLPSRTNVQFSYQLEVKYGIEDDTGWDLFNPFLIVGVPKSADDVLVLGQLQIKSNTGFKKILEDAVLLSKSKTLFSEGETLTDMRRKGLIHLRNRMDMMLLGDLDLLSRQEFL